MRYVLIRVEDKEVQQKVLEAVEEALEHMDIATKRASASGVYYGVSYAAEQIDMIEMLYTGVEATED